MTDTTDTKALRVEIAELRLEIAKGYARFIPETKIHIKLLERILDQLDQLDQLEAERQRADELESSNDRIRKEGCMTETKDIKALRDSAECMANLLDNLAGYEPSEIDMDTVELRFEDESGCDTGCDISIVGTAQQSADIIRALLDQLEAERQQREAAEKERVRVDGRNAELNSTLERWSVERAENANEIEELRAAIRGAKEPDDTIAYMMPNVFASLVNTARDVALEYKNAQCLRDALSRELKGYFTLTRQPKPVVVPSEVMELIAHIDDVLDNDAFERIDPKKWNAVTSLIAIGDIEAAGIVVKDGE